MAYEKSAPGIVTVTSAFVNWDTGSLNVAITEFYGVTDNETVGPS